VKKRRLVFSDAALADILEQADWYTAQSGRRLARQWEKAVTATVSKAARHPATGSPCEFTLPALRGVRRTIVSGFPKHLLFYNFDDDEIFILRVLHGARDLERLF